MAHYTRSQSSRSLSDSEPLSQAEVETISKNLLEKEKILREQSESLKEQAESLRKREIELEEKVANLNNSTQASFDFNELKSTLSELVKIRELPDQVRSLQQSVNNIKNHPPTFTPPPLQPPSTHPHDDGIYERTCNLPHARYEKYPIRLKDIADSIPKFDGHKISVFQFSKMCERALHLIPQEQEPFLVQLIINKLQGHAYTAVDGSEFVTMQSLLRRLKDVFGPNKSLNQYRGELGNIYMKYNESIFDYVERIKELRTAIIDAEAALHGYMNEFDLNAIDADILISFINGLPSDLYIRVKLEGYESLDDAIMKSIQIKKTMETEALRQKPSFSYRPPLTPRADTPRFKPQFSPETSSDTKIHSILQRPKSPSNIPFIKPLIPGQFGPNSPSLQTCHYCKTPGHFIADCQKLAYKRSLTENVGPSDQININTPSGNLTRVSITDDVRRDASQTGRRNQGNSVRFSEPEPTTSVQS